MKLRFSMPAIAAMVAIGLFLGAATARAADKNIVETAASAGQFNTLVTALKAAGLDETLAGPGPYTVFAPDDAAFAKLPDGTVETLLKPENKPRLVEVLTYHVVPGQVTAADVAKLHEAKTVNGKTLAVRTEGDAVMINDAKVTQADIMTSNGVIHVVDAVIIPPEH